MSVMPAERFIFPWFISPDWKLNIPRPWIFPVAVFVSECWKVMVPLALFIEPWFVLFSPENSRCCPAVVPAVASGLKCMLPAISPKPCIVPELLICEAFIVPPCMVRIANCSMLVWPVVL